MQKADARAKFICDITHSIQTQMATGTFHTLTPMVAVEFNTNPFIVACSIYKSIWPCAVETLFGKPIRCNAIKSLRNRLNNGKKAQTECNSDLSMYYYVHLA